MQIIFDPSNPQDRAQVMEIIGRMSLVTSITQTAASNHTLATPDIPATRPDIPLTDEVMRAAFKECASRIGREPAFAILHRYGATLAEIDNAKYPELYKELTV